MTLKELRNIADVRAVVVEHPNSKTKEIIKYPAFWLSSKYGNYEVLHIGAYIEATADIGSASTRIFGGSACAQIFVIIKVND